MMNVLITGIAGFVGLTLAVEIKKRFPEITLIGLDNFSRPGSELNRRTLKELGIKVFHADLRNKSDLEPIPPVDAVIDAAANPSVLAGVDGNTSSSQIIENNLGGTINLLEYCKVHKAAFILLSTSRVYSITGLNSIELETVDNAFRPCSPQDFPEGSSETGISVNFSTTTPISLYGASKLASEVLALEFGHQFDFQVWINRCGVLAGEGQFGRPDQGIFSFWINSFLRKKPLKYLGYGGHGHQVRDCLHPKDLVSVLVRQMQGDRQPDQRICNFGGGIENSISLAQLSNWCAERCGPHQLEAVSENRIQDVPWMVMDNREAAKTWNWEPITPIETILDEILSHARSNPNWLELSNG